ncbi:MAG: hypothetical protein AB7U83_20725 [Vicinamibacterales bacterium]
MTTRDSPSLLTLLGHELRAPAGVIGGYLTMIERQPLTPEQVRALDGARRAQQTVVDILDDVKRLVDVWRDTTPTARPVALTAVLDRTVAACGGADVDLEVSIHPDADLSVAAGRDVLAQAFTALATTVAREHAAPVVCDVTREGPGRAHAFALLAFLPRGRNFLAEPRRVDVHQWRPGLGLRLVVAIEHLRRLGGEAYDLVSGDQPAGVEVRLPIV